MLARHPQGLSHIIIRIWFVGCCCWLLLITPCHSMIMSSTTKHAALIFLHGLGDGPRGWSVLEKQLPALKPRLANLHYIFPQSPEIPISINGGMRMPGWFDIYEWPIQVGDPDDRTGQLAAVTQMEEEILQLEQQGIPRSKIVVGGFSQGGAIALLTAFHHYNSKETCPPLAGCVSLSGWLTLTDDFDDDTELPHKDTPLFWGHGQYDDKVVFAQQKYGVEKLSHAGVANLQFQSYPMGHESCAQELRDLADFLDETLFGKDDDDPKMKDPQDENKRSMIYPKQVTFHPFEIQLNQMSVSYPDSWVKKLFSAVPKRPFALEKLGFSFQVPQICIITGDSNSGKSTLLRVISKREHPTDGSCTWATVTAEAQSESYPVPIYLAASTDTPKYESYSSNHILRSSNAPISHDPIDASTFRDRLRSIVSKKTHSQLNERLFDKLFLTLANVFFTQSELDLTTEEGLSVSLSQSQIYRTRLLEASMESVLSQQTTIHNDEIAVVAPFILLDEWLDQETSIVIQAVQSSLEQLVLKTNATVFIVTHYPERWKLESATRASDDPTSTQSTTRRLILSRGKIISYK